LERSEALKDNVKSALQYPALVVIMAVLSMIILMTAVIPEFRPLFEEAGTDLPVSTQIVVAVSDFLGDYWWALAGGILLVMLLIRRHNADPAGRLRWDRWMLDMPMIGNLIKKIEVARLSRTLGTLLSNGVTVLNALSMTTEALGNQAVVEALAEVRGRLTKGERLADPLIEAGVFPPLALQLIQIGEESGKLEEMLLRVAEIYDDEVKRTIQRNLGLLVPLITIGVGILIAMIIGSILAAILSAYDLPF
jgi:general secretion pathway protein F